ncbi:TetR/AcrR family transcriptional regulator [Streptomyces sp. ISL-112]|uniref:TetR/AcrR family transcriptional regulator n=1 Tax=unclassified Streptomyces TaxID=2593676 RepID=UPI001BE713B3|nr:MULTISPECIES: TetR/AcrR family transcriptional regulator [unclassified Streptomyces]MBT2430405.1 TetR/AcrR family transcriptional regulator [Streptomyces sp. ISL-112]MBT2465784.1 TetR/AcrR family transcriptional regulator [Streptomyces sp. ISL-63]
MGRPRSFDESAVLDISAAEFRVHGFADTSTEQLCEATGVQRGSLYNAFTSKEELFIRALDRYAATFRERQAIVLTDADLAGVERLRAVLEAVVDEEHAAHEHGHGAGCMVVHTTMNPDLRNRDERIARILDRDLRERLSLLEGAIRAGQIDGSIPADIDPGEGALLFVTVVNGLRVMGQGGVDPATLHRVALSGIATLIG